MDNPRIDGIHGQLVAHPAIPMEAFVGRDIDLLTPSVINGNLEGLPVTRHDFRNEDNKDLEVKGDEKHE